MPADKGAFAPGSGPGEDETGPSAEELRAEYQDKCRRTLVLGDSQEGAGNGDQREGNGRAYSFCTETLVEKTPQSTPPFTPIHVDDTPRPAEAQTNAPPPTQQTPAPVATPSRAQATQHTDGRAQPPAPNQASKSSAPPGEPKSRVSIYDHGMYWKLLGDV